MTGALAHSIAAGAFGAGGGFMPERASSVAASVDHVFAVIFWVSASFLALILTVTIVFVVRYRRRPERPGPEDSPSHHTGLELLWSGIPLALVFVIFGLSTRTYLAMTEARSEGAALVVQVTARKWSWWFDHPGDRGAGELHLVAGRPTELVMASTDVIHSLYVPAFRLKQDAVPGRFTKMTFTPTVAGSFPILCAEYCGTDHSRMSAVAVVHPDQASFDAWVDERKKAVASLAETGKQLFLAKGCIACHSVDGSPGVGPSFKKLWGRQERITGGGTVNVDEEYVRESVLKPAAKVVDGFADIMPPIPLDDAEFQALVAYFKSLKDAP